MGVAPAPPGPPPRSAALMPTGAPGTREQKRNLRKLIDESGPRQPRLADELFHAEAICRARRRCRSGRSTKQIVQMVRAGFPDYWVKIDLTREDDRVAPASRRGRTTRRVLRDCAHGKEVKWTEMAILRSGRRSRHWFDSDIAG